MTKRWLGSLARQRRRRSGRPGPRRLAAVRAPRSGLDSCLVVPSLEDKADRQTGRAAWTRALRVRSKLQCEVNKTTTGASVHNHAAHTENREGCDPGTVERSVAHPALARPLRRVGG